MPEYFTMTSRGERKLTEKEIRLFTETGCLPLPTQEPYPDEQIENLKAQLASMEQSILGGI